ncbi:MAG: DUF4097 family beta strand repeat protein [Acidobacteria bacterium]|nr:DUF4097 family beta strand repeat protein [Acidobacteriota bacterium]
MTYRISSPFAAGPAVAIAGLLFAALPAGAQPDPARSWRDRLAPAWDAGALAAQGRDARSERVDRSTRTIALGTSGSLELKNVSGDISITAGSGRDVTLDITRRSRGRDDAEAALGLQQVQVNVDHRGERATVEVMYPHERDRGRARYQVNVSFVVTVPAGTRVTARSVSGNVSVKGVAGDLAVETVSGNIDVANARQLSTAKSVSGNVVLSNVESSRALSAGTVSGGVQLSHVRANRIAVDVVSGDIRTEDVTCASAQLKTLSGTVDYVGRFEPGGRYEFNSHSGSVRITAAGPVGFELQATTFSGRIRPEGLSLQAMTMNRGALRATVGDGSAVVVAQTFSGDVVITKR